MAELPCTSRDSVLKPVSFVPVVSKAGKAVLLGKS